MVDLPAALAWVRRHARSLPIVLGLLALTAVVIGIGIANYPTYGDDEGTYVAQAWAVLARGQLAHYTYWYDHPPLGWIQLALMTWVLGPIVKGATAVAQARALMLLPALVTAGLTYVLARRTGFRRPFAVLTVAALSLLGATLTLPGIAGIILGIGMSVDANILINERIREESRKGQSAFAALDHGFRRAFSTIVVARRTSNLRATKSSIARSSVSSPICPWPMTTFASGTRR